MSGCGEEPSASGLKVAVVVWVRERGCEGEMFDDGRVVHGSVEAIVEVFKLRIFFDRGNPFGARRLLGAPIGRLLEVGPDLGVRSRLFQIAQMR